MDAVQAEDVMAHKTVEEEVARKKVALKKMVQERYVSVLSAMFVGCFLLC